jgi:hypothetical protein
MLCISNEGGLFFKKIIHVQHFTHKILRVRKKLAVERRHGSVVLFVNQVDLVKIKYNQTNATYF